MSRFSKLDHFLLSGIIFDKSVISNHVRNDVDNFSDHEPIVLQVCPKIKILGVSERIHTPHVSWPKASKLDLSKYRSVRDLKLWGIILPTEALLCNNFNCNKVEHLRSIHVFAWKLSEACISAADESDSLTCYRKIAGRLPGWSEGVQLLRVK